MCDTPPPRQHAEITCHWPSYPSLVGPTNHILGVNNNAVILYNPYVTVSSRARSYLCHTLPLTYRHTPTHFTRLRGSDLVREMNGTDRKAGFPLSDGAFLLRSDWTPIIGTSLKGHCTKRGYRRFIENTFLQTSSALIGYLLKLLLLIKVSSQVVVYEDVDVSETSKLL